MKFGRNYHHHQIAEWADNYMNYGAFKRMCKAAREVVDFQGEQIQDVSQNHFQKAQFNTLMYSELVTRCKTAIDSVEHFYHNTYTTLPLKPPIRVRCQDLHHNIDFTTLLNRYEEDHVELHHYNVAIGELVAEVDKLRWYGHVNTDAFRKIIRRIHRLNANGNNVAIELNAYLRETEFSTQTRCLKALESLNEALACIAQSQPEISTMQVFCTQLLKVNPSICVLPIFRAIESDNSVQLGNLIDAICEGDLEFSRLQFIHVLFGCSVQCFSKISWASVVVSCAISLNGVVSIENWLRDIVIKLGRGQEMSRFDYELHLSLLTYILDHCLVRKINPLCRQDSSGRIPLHYACEYGLANVCEIFFKSMKSWDLSGAEDSTSTILLEDAQSRSPLQLSVLGHHPAVTRLLIKFSGYNHGNESKPFFSRLSTVASELLLLAVRSNSVEALAALLDTKIEINCRDALGQTPLYIAARSGNESLVNLLLPHMPLLDIYETVKNWTPLIIASLWGFSAIVETLLNHGADVEHRDLLGWTAIDHASYRGHILLAEYLVKATKSLNHQQAMEIEHQLKTPFRQKLPSRGQPRRTFSAVESHVVVNLGSLNLSDITPTVRLSSHLIKNPSIINPESLFSLGVSITGRAGPSHIISLPLLEDATNTPWTFTTTNPTDLKLAFEIYRNEPAATESRELVGRGMALLDSFKRSPHTKRENLNRDYTVSILSTATLEYIGAVTFSFIISTPLVLPNTPPINTEELWFENGPPKVVGHRGLGQNLLRSSRLQIGENSIQSFLSAVSLGASYVELDVQLTKDHVPVIYHDFLVSETGIDAPMHTLTYEQFMRINNEQSDQRLSTSPANAKEEYPLRRRVRALSSSASDYVETEALMDRVKHTFDYNSRGCKGNTRGDFIHDAFVTFEQLLTQLPPHIGMDIELKYPILSEAIDDWKMDPFFVEANYFTDTILLCLAKYISKRSILLSSFSPEICILLALKQSRWPVVFGTDSGNWQPADIRATTLQEGLRFAKQWNLDGLVLASEPLVYAPQLVGSVKGAGMVCATYGVLNDEAEGVLIQGQVGVDIIIVNNVRLVSETLAALQEN